MEKSVAVDRVSDEMQKDFDLWDDFFLHEMTKKSEPWKQSFYRKRKGEVWLLN